MSSTGPWYKRYPSDFLAGTMDLTLEEKGAYNVILDLIYDRGAPIVDNSRYIAGVCGCSVRKWNSIRDRLLIAGKITIENGAISNRRALFELENHARIARKLAENGAKGGAKSAEQRQKSIDFNEPPKPNAQAPLNHRARVQNPESRILTSTPSQSSNAGSPPTLTVRLSRSLDRELWAECVRLLGKEPPTFDDAWAFQSAIVDQAKQNLKTDEKT